MDTVTAIFGHAVVFMFVLEKDIIYPYPMPFSEPKNPMFALISNIVYI